MRKKGNNCIYRYEERQLVINSDVINRYAEIKEILEKNEKLYKSDLDLLGVDNKTLNILLYSFDEIVNEAQTEYRASAQTTEISENKKVRCSLCNTSNKYIYYIVNNVTGITLNVGSECINKFSGIYIDEETRQKIKQTKDDGRKIERKAKINNFFPYLDEYIHDLRFELNNNLIAVPQNIEEPFNFNINNAEKVYNDYLKSRINIEDAVKKISETKENIAIFLKSLRHFNEENANKEFICKLSLKKWLQANNEQLLAKVVSDGCYITQDTIEFIYEKSFLDENSKHIINIITHFGFTVKEIYENRVYINHNDYDLDMYIKSSDFMEYFGKWFFSTSNYIDDDDVKKKFVAIVRAESSEKNIHIVTSSLNQLIKNPKYTIEYDEEFGQIEYRNNADRNNYTYSVVDFRFLFSKLLSIMMFYSVEKFNQDINVIFSSNRFSRHSKGKSEILSTRKS